MSDDHANDFQKVVIHLTWATAPIPRGSSSNSTKISSNDFPNALSKTFRVCLIEWGFPFEWSFPKFSHKLLGNKSVLDPAHCANLKISNKTKKPNQTRHFNQDSVYLRFPQKLSLALINVGPARCIALTRRKYHQVVVRRSVTKAPTEFRLRRLAGWPNSTYSSKRTGEVRTKGRNNVKR